MYEHHGKYNIRKKSPILIYAQIPGIIRSLIKHSNFKAREKTEYYQYRFNFANKSVEICKNKLPPENKFFKMCSYLNNVNRFEDGTKLKC
jgi:hypothetical protein